MATCLVDRRDPVKIRHTVRELLRQRIFGLACGYEDANDAWGKMGSDFYILIFFANRSSPR